MKFDKRQTLPWLLVVGAIVFGLLVRTPAHAQDSAANYDIRISLYGNFDETERPLAQPPLTLVAIPVPADVKTIREFLVSLHFRMDPDAVGLLYDLNPQLGDALTPGEKVRFIQIPVTEETSRAISDGFVFKIHYDDSIIGDLLAARQKIHDLAAGFSKLPPARFDSGVREKSTDCIAGLSQDFNKIATSLEYRDQPTNHEALSQLRSEIELLLRTSGPLLSKDQKFTAVDQNTLCEIANDVAVKRKAFADTRGSSTLLRFPQAQLLVNTYDAGTHEPVSRFRVHYVAQALENDPKQEKTFSALSPVEWRIPEGNYIFWATKDPDPTPVSVRLSTPVRQSQDSKPQVVDLLVKH